MKNFFNLMSSYHKSKYQISTISHKISTGEIKSEKKIKEPVFKCRYVVVLVGFGIYFFNYAYRINMSVAIVAMVNNSAIAQETKAKSDSCPNLLMNATGVNDHNSNKWDGDLNWSPQIQGYILGSYYMGYLISQIPAGIMAERFGCKWLLFWSSFATAVCTLLIPVLSFQNAVPLILLMIIRGLIQGFSQSPVSIMAANWFPKLERGLLYSTMITGVGVGTCLGSIFTGYLCDSTGGWPSSFYAFGVAGLVLSALIGFFLFENPKVHPRISKAECNFILNNQENVLAQRRPRPPWRKMLTSVPVWATAIAMFGQVWAISQLSVVHAIFLGTILHYPIAENGLVSSAPFLLQVLMTHVANWLSMLMQKKKYASVDHHRKFMNSLGFAGFSACVLGMYFSGCNRQISIIFAILSMGFIGFSLTGCAIVPVDMSPTFSGTVQGVCITFCSTASFIMPVIVGYFTNEMQTLEQWNKVFFICIGVVLSAGIFFVIFGSAEVQPWNYVGEDKSEKDENNETRF